MFFCSIHTDYLRQALIFKKQLKDVAKITQGIGKKLNPLEARAGLSPKKAKKVLTEFRVYYFPQSLLILAEMR